MPRKYKGNMNGQRHDLDNESRNCQVDEIIRGGLDRPYESLPDARRDDYNPCTFCVA